MNHDLINLLFSKRRDFFYYTLRLVRSPPAAEDIFQTVAERLCKPIDEVVENGQAFLHACLFNAYRNYRAVNKKYVLGEGAIAVVENGIDHHFESDLRDSLALKRIRKESRRLTPKQEEVIRATLDGELNIDSSTPQYQTLKTHRRLATIELRRRLG